MILMNCIFLTIYGKKFALHIPHKHLEGLKLWDIFEPKNAPRKKDLKAVSIMFSLVSEERDHA